MCIIRYDWLIALYLFISLVCNAIFLIIKIVVSGKNTVILRFIFRYNCNKSLWKKIFLVSLHSCTSPLVCEPSQLPLLTSPTTCEVDYFQRLIFGNSKSPDKFTGKPKTKINIFIHIAHHLPIYEVNGTSWYQGHLSKKVFNLPQIMTKSSLYCCSTRRTTFRNWCLKKSGIEGTDNHEGWHAFQYYATARGGRSS